MPFHINQLTMVNGNGLYIFTVYVKYRGWMKTSGNTAPRHIITCHVQFNGEHVQQHCRKTESSPIYLYMLCAHWNSFDAVAVHIEAVYFF
jgi:hypothetical protein